MLALWLIARRPRELPATIVVVRDTGPAAAPPEPCPRRISVGTILDAARRLGALKAVTLTHGERVLWAFVLPDAVRGDATRFVLRAYERDGGGEWHLRAEFADLSVRPRLVDGEPSRVATGMRTGGTDVPFFVIVGDDDVRFGPGEGYWMAPASP